MNNDLNRSLFTAKDIMALLGVSSGQLFHWGRTWGLIIPEIKAQGRAFKNKYSFQNLLEIALIKELNDLGFEPSKIKQIIEPFDHGPALEIGWKGNVWDYFRDGREDTEEYDDYLKKSYTYPGFDKSGCLLLITKEKSGEYSLGYIDGVKGALFSLEKSLTVPKDSVTRAAIMINLSNIVKELEKKTGERL